MLCSQADVPTPLANRFLTQLCKHFEHKLAVTHGDGIGLIPFSLGPCRLAAADGVLTLRVEAAREEDVRQLEDVVARHLQRFAFRDPLTVTWRPAEA